MSDWIERQLGKHPNADREVLEFIDGFNQHEIGADVCLRHIFMSGYCYYFAHILKTAFNRGEVVWVCPYGHIAWQDVNGIAYDFFGVNDDEYLYYIPEQYLGDAVMDFKHIPNKDHNTDVIELSNIIKRFEKAQHTKAENSKIEEFFRLISA